LFFDGEKHSIIMPRAWYSYKGSGDPYLPSNYTLMTVDPGCINGPVLCAIYTFDGGETPTGPFSANIRRYISNCIGSQLAQPQVPINALKYVLAKSGI
jgi:hypothetical protein